MDPGGLVRKVSEVATSITNLHQSLGGNTPEEQFG
jgi:hypothetical protein